MYTHLYQKSSLILTIIYKEAAMRINLNNIGIVHDSTMALDGLTVITGKNNSGKTTVGKAIYSLLDAVSNISAKARLDREQYIVKILDDVTEAMDLFRFFTYTFDYDEEKLINTPFSNCPALLALFSHDYRNEMSQNEIEKLARNIYDELSSINVSEISKTKQIEYYIHRTLKSEDINSDISKIVAEQLNKAASILQEMFETLDRDPQLIEYARESINQTLNVEFSGQIQPASYQVDKSKIELFNDDTCCFSVDIVNNKVEKNGKPVYFTSPYKKAFFIDNPFIFDESFPVRRWLKNPIDSNSESLLNPNNIISHNNKLRFILRSNRRPTVLEQTILNESLEKIKKEIDAIIPGTFEFSSAGDFYVKNGTKLKVSNLATGSKMFSIIKLLLEKGELGDSTMLILDEPEAHLHPSWQNRFAEMIVLLVKELGVNIVLTTHSSNFVLALDAYMRKHRIEDKTNFYRTEFIDNGFVDYVCTNDDIGTIYQDFLQYLSEVKMLRNEFLRNTGE